MLSDSESEKSQGEDLHTLTINEHYAKAFEYKKEREELQKLKEKYGSDLEDSDALESDSESDESEDEHGEELTPIVDAAILRTLARIKRKDPAIYDSKTNIFGEEHQKIGPTTKRVAKSKDKAKPVTMRQVALQSALDSGSRSPSPEPLTHVEEQRALRDEAIAAFHDAIDDKDGEDDLLVPREKTKDEQELEEEDYRTFLEREVGGDLKELVEVQAPSIAETAPLDGEEGQKDKKRKKKKSKQSDPSKDGSSGKSKEDADQEFLINYILNRGWIDRSANRIPTYGEITSTKVKDKKKAQKGQSDESAEEEDDEDEEALPTADPDLDEEEFEEIIDRFESSYNFRFEEPDAATIPSYPRNLPSLVRREDTTRKDARERRKQRKEEELQKRREEVKRLKGLKMKEIRARLEVIGREGGKSLEEDKALQELDLDADWDPTAHDRQMAELYGDDGDVDAEKPHWDDDIDIGDIPLEDDISTKTQKKKKKKKADKITDDDGVDIDAMDADAERTYDDDEEWDGTEEMRKRKLEEYMDEIYGLDFNDLVGDLPTRFRYVPVQSQNYGLTPVEILMGTDQELNEYMSIKKYAPYRQKETRWDSQRNDRLKELKGKVANRMGGSGLNAGDGGEGDKPVKKRKGKKERLRLKAPGGDEEGPLPPAELPPAKRKHDFEVDEPADHAQTEDNGAKKKRRRKQKKAET